jgi:hypothetical protein
MATGFKKATVDSGSVAATLTNYPSYVDLSRLGITTQQEADSVRVYADSGKTTEWAREIVNTGQMHVKIPSLTTTTDIYVDWDDSSADYGVTDTYGRNNVWSDYASVWHMEESNTTRVDSTGNGQSLADTGSVGVEAGGIDNGAHFTSTAEQLKASASTIGIANAYTISYWVNGDNWTPNPRVIIIKETGGNNNLVTHLIGATTGYFYVDAFNSSGVRINQYRSNTGLSISTLYKIAFSWNGTVGDFWSDGANLGGTYVTGAGSGSQTDSSREIFISNTNTGTADFLGMMDELRFRPVVTTTNWELTEFNNQDDESTFWGTWTDAGAATSIKSVNGLAQASVKSVNGLAIASVKSVNGLSNVS